MTFATDSPPSPLEWKFSQVFGERASGEDVQDIDIISAIEFEKSGDYLAVGDRGGRVVIFERKDGKDTSNQHHSRNELKQLDFTASRHPEFQYKTEFQSHEPEFDYLKSLEIEEKINKVRWCATPNGSLFILSTNDKTIKMWKVKERKAKKVKEMDPNPFVCSENALLAERSFVSGQHNPSVANGYHLEWTEKAAKNTSPSQEEHAKIAYIGDTAHDFNINSISNNSDGETFISADDLRINLWNLETSNQFFNIIDMKPSNMEDLTEVITAAEFHPIYCNLLAYSSSRGFIRLVDMRQSALCDHSARILQDGESHGFKSFFTEIIASISDIKFASDGRHVLSRDYMNLKLWDMDSLPVATYKIHEYLRPKLCDLYNNDYIFNKFECCLSGDGLHFATGSYSNLLRIFSGVENKEGITVEESKNPSRSSTCVAVLQMHASVKYHKAPHDDGKLGRGAAVVLLRPQNRKPHLQAASRPRRSSLSSLTRGFYRQGHENSSSGSGEFSCNLSSKLLHVAWHPMTNLIACAAGNSLFYVSCIVS